MSFNTNKKRKIEDERRSFQEKWGIQYFFIQSKNQVLCLICRNSLAVCKEYNIKRHYDTNHKENYDKYTGKLREDKFSELKKKHFRNSKVYLPNQLKIMLPL